MNMKRKRVELDTWCPICNRLDKDGDHLFFRCKYMKHTWRILDLEETRLVLSECPSLWSLENAKRDVELVLL